MTEKFRFFFLKFLCTNFNKAYSFKDLQNTLQHKCNRQLNRSEDSGRTCGSVYTVLVDCVKRMLNSRHVNCHSLVDAEK